MINIIPGAVESEIINTSMEKEKRDRLMVLKNILYKSKKMVARWGGKLYFVYMSPHPHNNKYPIEEELLSREFVIPFVRELNIPLIDLNTELFGIHPDPKSLFPLRVFGHYTPEGYRLVAETISQRLKDDGIIPSNLDN